VNEKLVRDFVVLFTTIDPIGSLMLFLAVTSSVPPKERNRIALRAVFFAGLILIGFLVIGQIVLDLMDIQLFSFQIAGSIILFILGLQMVFGSLVSETTGSPEPGHDLAIFPLAIPSIAGPGAILAAVLLTDNHRYPVTTQLATAGVLIFVLLIVYILLRLSAPIHRVIGNSGAAVLIRIMGMLLAALAMEEFLKGIVSAAAVLMK